MTANPFFIKCFQSLKPSVSSMAISWAGFEISLLYYKFLIKYSEQRLDVRILQLLLVVLK